MDYTNPKLVLQSLQNVMISIGRGGDRKDPEYPRLRETALSFHHLQAYLPEFVITCRDGAQFWGFIQKLRHYSERDAAIWKGFENVFGYLESSAQSPAANDITQVLQVFDPGHVHSAWQKALARRNADPEAALTSARTLLESTCKHILDGLGVAYNDSADLPDLYATVAKAMNLSPSQHTEQVFKQVLGGCHSVVQGLGAMRNRLGDAHGKGSTAYRPLPRHAALAVNLRGAMAMYLVETFEARKPGP